MSSLEPDAVGAARTRLGLVALLVGLAALAWWSTVRAMDGMAASPGRPQPRKSCSSTVSSWSSCVCAVSNASPLRSCFAKQR